MSKLNVPMTIVRPPDYALRGRTFAIQEGKGVDFPDHRGLKLKFEQSISTGFTPDPAKPDIRISYAVSNYQPVSVRTYTVSETRYIKVGEESYTDKNGKAKTRDKFDSRNVPVEYWESAGSAKMVIQTFDAENVMVDTFEVSANCVEKRMISENGTSKVSASDPLPGQPALLARLVDQAAFELQKRYTKTRRNEMVMLAKDDPLKNGNEAAKQGNWKSALSMWSDSGMKREREYQFFNMAVANEALAYAAYDKTDDPKDAEAHFSEALRLYEEAKKLNAKEKYFERASKRIEEFKANRERSLKIQETISRDIERAQQEAIRLAAEKEQKEREEKERQAKLDDDRADSAMEKEFRADVRARIRNAAEVKDTDQQKFRDDGQIFKLEPLQIDRVLHQEFKRANAIRQGRARYAEVFKEFVADKRITAEERERLKVRQNLLKLPDDEIAAIEKEAGEFVDETAPKPAPEVTSAANPVKKAVRVQAPTPQRAPVPVAVPKKK